MQKPATPSRAPSTPSSPAKCRCAASRSANTRPLPLSSDCIVRRMQIGRSGPTEYRSGASAT